MGSIHLQFESHNHRLRHQVLDTNPSMTDVPYDIGAI